MGWSGLGISAQLSTFPNKRKPYLELFPTLNHCMVFFSPYCRRGFDLGCIIYSPQPVTQRSQEETLEGEIIPWRQICLFPELKFLTKLNFVDQFS